MLSDIQNLSMIVLIPALATNSLLNAWLIANKSEDFQFVLLTRIVGALILLLPNLSYYKLNYDLTGSGNWLITSIILLPFSLIAITLNRFRRISNNDLSVYAYLFKQVRLGPFFIKEITSFILYLLPYELLFRGMLLSYLCSHLNTFLATAINTILYALAHIQQGMREFFGALFFGILLCLATLATHSFWVAFFMHFILAVSNSYFLKYRYSKQTAL